MSKILDGIEGALDMTDDILIFRKDRKEHEARLAAALTRIRDAGVTLNRESVSLQNLAYYSLAIL